MSQPAARPTASEAVRASLSHPVIDADGHFLEFMPVLARYLQGEGIMDPTETFLHVSAGFGSTQYERLTPQQRIAQRAVRCPWWSFPAENTRDIATATLPGLMHERLPELGIDFAVAYPSAGLTYPHVQKDDTRQAACRALNRYSADVFSDYADRITPAAVIPMHTPAEAIEQLEFAVQELGLKAIMIAGFVERPIEDVADGPHRVWWDLYGIDSLHDYDPFWKRCIELGVAPAAHSGAMGIGFRRSTSNYMFNHTGHFAAAGEALAKALYMGGVTHRFPELRVAFLEGGVHWAVGLFADTLARWKKRNIDVVQRYDPRRIDQALFGELVGKYGAKMLASLGEDRGFEMPLAPQALEAIDDFAAMGAEKPEDLRDQFVPCFYFGCEADDPMTPTAFRSETIPFGAQIKAMFSSDVGHWDVPDMNEVLEEAYENVEHGWLDAAQFRDFTFANAARFYTDANPRFFEGTRVEGAVAAELLAHESR
jgi:predicted TIM-barrel fold metal-dependent hydrolase